MPRGKRRSLAQRIGKKGEGLFQAWAVDHQLSPNKVDDDLGVDFFCQVLRPRKSGKSEDVTGAVLAVQVKAVLGNSRPRIQLDKTDAVDLLRQTHPACLVGLHINAGRVGYLFLDEAFINRLQDFVASARKSHSIPLDEMEFDSGNFVQKLVARTRPGAQHRLAIYKAQRAIESTSPNTFVAIEHSSEGGRAIVQMPWIASAFSIDPETRDEVRRLAFEAGALPDQWPGVAIKPEFSPLFDLADGPAYLLGAFERDEVLTIASDGETASATFRVRRLGDEFASVHDIGLALVHSDRRQREEIWVHEMEARLFHGSLSIGMARDELSFFRLLRPGARVQWHGTPVAVETWGQSVSGLGRSVVAIEEVMATVGVDLNDVFLGDLLDEEFATSLGFLEAIFIEKIAAERIIPGFIVDLEPDADVDKIPTTTVTIELPVVLNVKATGIVVWIRARASMFLSEEGQWSGIRVQEQLDCWYTIHPRFEKSVLPELWVTSAWPTIPLPERQEETPKFRRQAPDKFVVEARVLGAEEPVRGEDAG